MTEPVSIDAPRPNHSTGPKTPEGKRRCALNAYRHGLTGQLDIITPEEQIAYDQHSQINLESMAPANAYERSLAQSIADDRWRLIRARSIESGIFALGFQAPDRRRRPAFPRSTTPSPKPAPGSTTPAISSSSPSTNSASSVPSTRTWPSSKP